MDYFHFVRVYALEDVRLYFYKGGLHMQKEKITVIYDESISPYKAVYVREIDLLIINPKLK